MADSKKKSNGFMAVNFDGKIMTVKTVIGEILFDTSKPSDTLQEHARLHGWKQRIADGAALVKPERKKGISDAEWAEILRKHAEAKHAGMGELVEYYEQGDVPWKMNGGGERAEAGLFVSAVMELRGWTEEKTKDALKRLDKKTVAEIRASKSIVEIMNRLRAERAGTAKEAMAELDAFDSQTDESTDDESAEESDESTDESADESA